MQQHHGYQPLTGAVIARLLTSIAASAAFLSPPHCLAANAQPEQADPLATTLPISIDGPAVRVDASAPGTLVRLGFEAKTGQHLGIGINGVTLTPASASALVVTIRDAGGKRVPTPSRVLCLAPSAVKPLGDCQGQFSVPHDGRYRIEVETPFSAGAKFTAVLSSALEGALEPDVPRAVRLERAGQAARFPLRIGADEGISVEVQKITAPDKAEPVSLRIYRPDGKLAAQANGIAASGITMPVPPEAGEYIVEAVPVHGEPASFVVVARRPATLEIGGAPVPFGPAGSTELVRYRFAGKEGEGIEVLVDPLSIEPEVEIPSMVAILGPDGHMLGTSGCGKRPPFSNGPCKATVAKLPFTGRYEVLIRPAYGAKMSGQVSATRDIVGSFEGNAVRLPALQKGQVARYRFKASAGESVGFSLTGMKVQPEGTLVYVMLMRPQGMPMTMRASRTGSVQLDPVPLPAEGEYSILVDSGTGELTAGELALVRH